MRIRTSLLILKVQPPSLIIHVATMSLQSFVVMIQPFWVKSVLPSMSFKILFVSVLQLALIHMVAVRFWSSGSASLRDVRQVSNLAANTWAWHGAHDSTGVAAYAADPVAAHDGLDATEDSRQE